MFLKEGLNSLSYVKEHFFELIATQSDCGEIRSEIPRFARNRLRNLKRLPRSFGVRNDVFRWISTPSGEREGMRGEEKRELYFANISASCIFKLFGQYTT